MKYLRIYNVFCQYIKFSCMYVIPVKCTLYPHQYTWSTLVLYFVFTVLIQIMGKQNLKLFRQKRSSYINKRCSHTVRLTPAKRLKTVIPSTHSQTLHSCLASIPQGTPSKNLHTYLARTPKTTPPKRLMTYFPSKRTHPASLLRQIQN